MTALTSADHAVLAARRSLATACEIQREARDHHDHLEAKKIADADCSARLATLTYLRGLVARAKADYELALHAAQGL